MADVGFGLTREDIVRLAFNITEKSGRKHPFSGNKAGRGWFEGFKARHPKLTLRIPQPLSYCRALCSNQEVIDDFFGKLGAIYGRLNLVAKPMQVFNADETGISVVHKPGKVVAELGRHYVYALTSAEKGKIHTILTCTYLLLDQDFIEVLQNLIEGRTLAPSVTVQSYLDRPGTNG